MMTTADLHPARLLPTLRLPALAEEVVCSCGHVRRLHSKEGCTACACPVTYMDLSPRR